MRGNEQSQEAMFSYVSPAQRVPQDHPLRPIRRMVDEALKELSPKFERMYSDVGRPSIPPEQLLRALLLQVFYTVRSERLLMEQLDYNLLFRWFVGLSLCPMVRGIGMDDRSGMPRYLARTGSGCWKRTWRRYCFPEGIWGRRGQNHLLSNEHFTVDGTLDRSLGRAEEFQEEELRQTRAAR